MRIINKDELLAKKEKFKRELKNLIFIHPTDTIYGIGCDATNTKLSQKIRNIKNRPNTPFSVLVPSKEWIYKNCKVNKSAEEWINKLPGPYTLILELKNKKSSH